jgi:hypothetical protein
VTYGRKKVPVAAKWDILAELDGTVITTTTFAGQRLKKFYPRGDVSDIQFSRRGSPTQLRGEGIALEDNNNDAGDDSNAEA